MSVTLDTVAAFIKDADLSNEPAFKADILYEFKKVSEGSDGLFVRMHGHSETVVCVDVVPDDSPHYLPA